MKYRKEVQITVMVGARKMEELWFKKLDDKLYEKFVDKIYDLGREWENQERQAYEKKHPGEATK